MSTKTPDPQWELERYCNYLRLLARLQLDPRLRGKDRARRDYDAAREQIEKIGRSDAETRALLTEAAAIFGL